MKFVITGGGTGGHIFPGIAIADELKKKINGADILFIGAKGRMEEKVVPDNGYKIKTINISGFQRKNLLKNWNTGFKLIGAVTSSKRILKEFAPDAVIGTGGYVSGPVVYSAVKLRIPALIEEGNSYPGFVTKYLSDKVNRVVINFDETAGYLKPGSRTVKISYPVRNKLIKRNRIESLKFFGFDNTSAKTLFVFGGSQGARANNSVIMEILDELSRNNINVIWQTGRTDYKNIFSLISGKYPNVKVFEFINEMDFAYSAADLVVCRAGISSIMELSLLRMHSVLIPYPFASENHQEKNAQALVSRNAAIMINESQIGAELKNVILNTINDTRKLNALSANISGFYDADAPSKIVNEILNITGYGTN
jgi:UDP-N-acetylglucosamine--N-acetylmuramyl-(pentapeptide) pyrophosphoryl-undecaprenol N-acetylglucosamine transferase